MHTTGRYPARVKRLLPALSICYLLPLALLILGGCTPSYTGQALDRVARQVQLYDDYAISRWHHRVYSRQAGFCVAMGRDAGVDRAALLSAVASHVAADFRHAIVVEGPLGRRAALDNIQCVNSDYLLYVKPRALDCQALPQPAGSGDSPGGEDETRGAGDAEASKAAASESMAEAVCASRRYTEATLHLDIYEVTTAQRIDGVILAVEGAWLAVNGQALEKLLDGPLRAMSKQLVGEPAQ